MGGGTVADTARGRQPQGMGGGLEVEVGERVGGGR